MSKRAAVRSSRDPGVAAAVARAWHVRLAAAVVAVAGLVAYANSLSGPFVFDDLGSIVDNPSIRSLWPPVGVLSPPADDGQTVGGRPVLNLSFALNHALGGLSVTGYHAVNLAVHLGGALLLLGIVRRTLENRASVPAVPLATASALLWCLHPLTTAAVTYVVQRAESLAGFFILLTLYAFIRGIGADQGRAARWRVLAVAACLLGMASKETAAVAPLLVFVYDRTFVSGSFGGAWTRRRGFYVALGATWLLLAWLVAGTDSRGGSAGFAAVTSRWDYLLTQAGAIVHYLRLALWPHPLTFDHGMRLVAGLGEVWPQALVVVAILAATAWAVLRGKPAGFAGAWFFLLLAPSSSLVPVTSQTVAEHRMYLPLAAVVTVVVLALHRMAPRGAPAVCVVAAVALGATTFARNRDYRTAVDLWADTVAKRPDNPRAHTNLGTALAQAGRTDEAIRSYRAALQVYPDHASAHYNLGVALAAAGRPADAIEPLATAVRLEPALVDARINLGNALVRTGRPGEAVPHYEEALRLRPDASDAVLNLGLALVADGRHREAIDPLRRALAVLPGQVDARFALGNALARSGEFPGAIDAYRDVLRLAPGHVAARGNLANALLVTGRAHEAIAEYEAVLRLQPGDSAVRANLEQARALARAGGGMPSP